VSRLKPDLQWSETLFYSRGKLAAAVTICLALLILAAGLRLLLPFFEPICWAIILALFFNPVYGYILKLCRGLSGLASLLTCFLIIIFIIIPVFALLASVTSEIIKTYSEMMRHVQAGTFSLLPDPEQFPRLYKAASRIMEFMEANSVDLTSSLITLSKGAGEYVLAQGTAVFRNAATILFKGALMMVILFYLFTDGAWMLSSFKRLLPMSQEAAEEFMRLTSDVLSATLYGNLLTGALQAGLAIIIFWALDFSSAILLGILLGLSSFIPIVGTALVWGPAVLYLFFTGSYVKCVILLALCILVISQIDYFLRPYFISGKTELHNLFLFLGILGGIDTFGLLGLILGPILVALCVAILELYASNFLHRAKV